MLTVGISEKKNNQGLKTQPDKVKWSEKKNQPTSVQCLSNVKIKSLIFFAEFPR